MSGRRLGATLLGLLAGAAGFAVLVLFGYLVSLSVWGGSAPKLVVIVAPFGAAGLYAGWILGMLVFSAVRGPDSSGDGEAA